MRQVFYGMRRADGDWFALEVKGETRVPVFRSLDGAWRARAKNPELMLFRPALLDERALDDLATADDGRPAAFLVVEEDDPASVLTRGHTLEFEQLAILEGARRLPRPRTFGRPPLMRAVWVGRPARRETFNEGVVGDEARDRMQFRSRHHLARGD